jgi:chitodextrinase
MKKWVTDVRKATGKPMFTFGEYWSGNTQLLLNYLDAIDETFSVLDVDLHHRFQNAANGNGNYDLKQLLPGTITDLKPNLSMTFVDNHDTQPGQALQSWVADWFKPQSYAVILTRQEGVPVVFYGDYYGIPNNNIGAMKNKIDPILIARKDFAYGKQHDYFDDNDVVGWTREGVADRAKSGLATVISDGQAGSKKMFVGKQHAGEVWFDLTNNRSDQVRISNTGWGTFPVNSKSLSIYVQKESFVPDNTPPSAPTQAVVKEKTDTSITLNWSAATDNERVISYDVYRDDVKVQTTNETMFTDSGLSPETNYNYKIIAVDGAGNESSGAATVAVKTGSTSGNVVTIYYKQGYTTPYIHYRPAGGQWTSPPGVAMKSSEVSGYFKHTINLGNSTKIEACFNDGASNWDSNNRANYMIDAGVATFIPGPNGSPGTIKSGKPTQQNSDVTPPSAPTALKVNEKSKNTVSVSWTASRDNVAVQGYELHRDSVKIASLDDTSYTDNGLTPNTSYVYTVKAFDAAGNVSAASAPVNVTTDSGEKTNSVTIYYKKGLPNPHIHYRTINGSWTDVPGVAMPAAEVVGYHKIDIDLGADTELEACFNNGANVWDSNQSKNYKFSSGVYTFTPGANGNSGKITQGAPAGIVPGDEQAPSIPNGLKTVRLAMNQISFAWSPASDNVAIASYEVYRNSIKVGTVNGTKFTDSGLAAGTPHTYTVRAIDSSGNVSPMSAELVATTVAPPDNRVDGSSGTTKQTVLVVGNRITVNGKALPSSVQSQNLNGRIMVPFKALFESLGTKVSWNSSTRTLRASKTNFNMTMQANVRTATVNGKVMTLEVPPVIIRGTTYVPLRFVADSLGATVQYRAK